MRDTGNTSGQNNLQNLLRHVFRRRDREQQQVSDNTQNNNGTPRDTTNDPHIPIVQRVLSNTWFLHQGQSHTPDVTATPSNITDQNIPTNTTSAITDTVQYTGYAEPLQPTTPRENIQQAGHGLLDVSDLLATNQAQSRIDVFNVYDQILTKYKETTNDIQNHRANYENAGLTKADVYHQINMAEWHFKGVEGSRERKPFNLRNVATHVMLFDRRCKLLSNTLDQLKGTNPQEQTNISEIDVPGSPEEKNLWRRYDRLVDRARSYHQQIVNFYKKLVVGLTRRMMW